MESIRCLNTWGYIRHVKTMKSSFLMVKTTGWNGFHGFKPSTISILEWLKPHIFQIRSTGFSDAPRLIPTSPEPPRPSMAPSIAPLTPVWKPSDFLFFPTLGWVSFTGSSMVSFPHFCWDFPALWCPMVPQRHPLRVKRPRRHGVFFIIQDAFRSATAGMTL